MPSPHRRPRLQARGRITPEAIAAYVADDWMGLHRALGLRPWEASPLDVGDEPPSWATETEREKFLKAIELRRKLEDAVAT